jgi:general secretion pathway protein A
VVVAQINQTQVSAIDFLQAVLVQFGFSPFKMKKAELIATINNFLIEQYAAGRKPWFGLRFSSILVPVGRCL